MVSKKKNGFTIVELLLSMVGFAIIAVTVGAMLVYAWQGWRKSMESMAMQQNAEVAMRIIEHGIRNGSLNPTSPNQISTNASSINFAKADDSDFSTAELTMGGSMVSVTSFNVATNAAGGFDVSFALSTASGADDNTYRMTIYPRN